MKLEKNRLVLFVKGKEEIIIPVHNEVEELTSALSGNE
jgi:hypothetical protein